MALGYFSDDLVLTRTYNFLDGFVSHSILAMTEVRTEVLPTEPLLSKKNLIKLKKGHFQIIGWPDFEVKKSDKLTIFVAGPRPFLKKSETQKKEEFERLAEIIIKAKPEILVYASDFDQFLALEKYASIRHQLNLRKTVRAVIFDGGHHVNSLNNNADLLITPVLKYKKKKLIAHTLTRDAIPFDKLIALIKRSNLKSGIISLRRYMPLKNDTAMAYSAIEGIRKVGNKHRKAGKQRFSFYLLKPDKLKAFKPKAKPAVVSVVFGESRFPSLEKPPFALHARTKAHLNNKNVEILDLPLSAWDIIKPTY